jgi:hypothetical protein
LTETDWLTSCDVQQLLDFIRPRTTERKRRLFACACCRRFWDRFQAEESRRAVEVAERFADGLASADELAHAQRLAWAAFNDRRWEANAGPAEAAQNPLAQDFLVSDQLMDSAWLASASLLEGLCQIDEPTAGEVQAQRDLIRDIFGNPFRRAVMLPAWRTETVTRLARWAYDERAFDTLPVLADALEDAGCDTPALLEHLREPGPHARGCWALDLILGLNEP